MHGDIDFEVSHVRFAWGRRRRARPTLTLRILYCDCATSSGYNLKGSVQV